MRSLLEIEVLQEGNGFTGLENILARSPHLQILKLESDCKMSFDTSTPIDQTVAGINLSRCALPCIRKLVLLRVVLEVNTLKNLLSNVKFLTELEILHCNLKGLEMITFQVPSVLRLFLSIKKCGHPAVIVAPDLQVK